MISRTLISRTFKRTQGGGKRMPDEGKPALGAGKWALGAGAALLSQLALAVGMGELQLHSAMEERLVAEIDLLNIGDLNEHQMVVRLASPEDFENAGIDRDFRLSELRFQVSLDNPQRPVIRISSRQPIQEPYLNFLIELRWPSGRLLREYTALLDLPTFAGAPAPGKTSAATPPGVAAEPHRAAPRTAPVYPPRSTPRRGAATAPPAVVDADGRVQVRAGDTLWAIAQHHRGAGASIHQVMEAIAAANPDAFIGGNVNLIRRDAWLQIPDAAAMRAADASRLGLSQLRPATAPPALESRSETPAAPAERVDGELKLTSAAGTAAEEGAGGKGNAPAEPGLAGVLEERDRLQRENDELKHRVQSLEAQLGTTSRLAEIEAPGVGALHERSATQEQSAKQEQPATVPGASPEAAPETAGTAAAEAPAVDAAGVVETPLQEPVTAAVPAAPEPATVAVPSAEASKPAPADPSAAAAPKGPLAAIEALGDWALPALGATAALVLGLLALVGLRRRSGIQQRGLVLPGEKDVVPRNLRGAAVEPEPEPAHEELFAAPTQVEESESIVNEAEVCLSFGNEEQAEELLRDGLDKYPQDTKLHLKLLAVLVARADRAGFDAHLPKLAALGDLAAFAEAQSLQAQFADDIPAPWELPEGDTGAPGVMAQKQVAEELAAEELAAEGPVAEELAADVAEARADVDELATDIAEVPDRAGQMPATPAEAAALADVPLDDFDLDLELDLPEATPIATQAAPALAREDSALESIDLGSLDLGSVDLENVDLGFDEAEPAVAEPPVGTLDVAETPFDTSFDDLELFEPGQELATQLELARAYVDMGDVEGAREILDHVAAVGDASQRETARELLARLG